MGHDEQLPSQSLLEHTATNPSPTAIHSAAPQTLISTRNLFTAAYPPTTHCARS
ncbi:hypothetical protein M3J09_011620 [Ascochyta lentis]